MEELIKILYLPDVGHMTKRGYAHVTVKIISGNDNTDPGLSDNHGRSSSPRAICF